MNDARLNDIPIPRIGRYKWLLFFLLPLLLGLIWGPYFADNTYVDHRFAQNLAAGRGLAYDASVASRSAPHSPLIIGFLAILTFNLQSAALILSAVGWGATAVSLYRFGQTIKRPMAGTIAAAFILISPWLVVTLGSAIPWALALGWTSVCLVHPGLEIRDKWRWLRQTAVFLIFLAVYIDASTVGLVVLLLGFEWWYSRRFPWRQAVLVTLASLAWGWYAISQWEWLAVLGASANTAQLGRYLWQSELVIVLLPFLVLGIFEAAKDKSVDSKPVKPSLLIYSLASLVLWTVLAVLLGNPLAGPVTAVLALFLVGLGVEWVVKWLSAKEVARINPAGLALIFTLGLLLVQLVILWQQYQARPAPRFTLENQTANWLQANSDPGAIIYTTSRIGFLADRTTLPAELNHHEPTILADQFSRLIRVDPDFIVSDRSIPWQETLGLGWFRYHYKLARQFSTAEVANAPFSVWERVATPFDTIESQPVDAIVPGRIRLVGYAYEPKEIQPGDDIYLTLYLEAVEPITVGFLTEINLTYAFDEWVWAWRRELTPRTIPGQVWQPGQVIPEYIRLKTEETIPYGAYKLQVLWKWADDEKLWPIYRDGDVNVLDRVMLGYVAFPPPEDAPQFLPVNARFGDQITLLGYEIVGEGIPGESVEVILYWQALRPPVDNYYVFVQLIDISGQPLVVDDNQPMNGRYATRAWLPGTTVKDSHLISLPDEVSPGTYQLLVGMYTRQTGDRLPVVDATGIEQANGSLLLAPIEIGSAP